jgi:hypothetical protein
MAYGDDSEGTLFLYEVPPNLRNKQEREEQVINEFWEREISKCNDTKERRVVRKEEFSE